MSDKKGVFLGFYAKHEENLKESDAVGGVFSLHPNRVFKYAKRPDLIKKDRSNRSVG